MHGAICCRGGAAGGIIGTKRRIRGMTTTRFKVSGGNDARVKELRGILERDPLNVNQRFMLASALESDGKLADSVKELGVAIEKGRRNLGTAHCYYAMGLMKV